MDDEKNVKRNFLIRYSIKQKCSSALIVFIILRQNKSGPRYFFHFHIIPIINYVKLEMI